MSFEVTGGGTVTPQHLVTDAGGRATVNLWTLGHDLGIDTLIARVANLPPVYFTVRVGLPLAAKAIVSGDQSTCAISLDGNVYCWGDNTQGQVSPGDSTGRFTAPQRVPLPAKAVSLAGGYSHTCAISNESPPQAYCWGSNSYGQVGGSATRASGPFRVPVPDGLASVTAGGEHSCGLSPAGVAYCWGFDFYGQLGTGVLTCTGFDPGAGSSDCLGPQRVAGNLTFVSIAAGLLHTCGLTSTGQLYCWGLNDAGQLGAPTDSPCQNRSLDYHDGYAPYPVPCALAPQLVPGALPYTSLAAGDEETCALTSPGAVTCYGSPTGLASNAMAFTSLAPDGTCGVRSDGSAYCWAAQTFDSRGASFDQPVPIGSGFAFSAITAGRWGHRCGIRQGSSTVLCWGANFWGSWATAR